MSGNKYLLKGGERKKGIVNSLYGSLCKKIT